jgi:hypothetical protein
MFTFENTADEAPPILSSTPLEQAVSLIEIGLLTLPAILRAPFHDLTMPIIRDAAVTLRKVTANDKLAVATTTPRSARHKFSLSASAMVRKTQEFAMIEADVKAQIASHEAALTLLIKSVSDLEVSTHTKHLAASVITTMGKFSDAWAILHPTEIPIEEHLLYKLSVVRRCLHDLRSTELIGASLPVDDADFFVYVCTVFDIPMHSNILVKATFQWDALRDECANVINQLILKPIDRLVKAAKAQATHIEITRILNQELFGTASTANAVVADDDESTVDPELVEQITDKVMAALRAAGKKKPPRNGGPKKQRSRNKPRK